MSDAGTPDSCFDVIAIGEDDLPNYAIEYTTSNGSTKKTCAYAADDYEAGCFQSDGLVTAIDSSGGAGSGSW